MEILYKNLAVEKDFSSAHRSKWKYPKKVAEKLQAAETVFKAATSLHDIACLPQYKLHRLTSNRKNEWSIYLGNTGWRVTFIPCDEAGNTIIDGDILAKCKTIKVVLITEVSNHYE